MAKRILPLVVGTLACVSAAHAQAARDIVPLEQTEAELSRYEAVLATDSANYEALWNAAAISVDLAEFHPDTRQRDTLFAQAERYARRAVAANPQDAEGHFQLARALGRIALTKGSRERVKYAVEIREQALAALNANEKHGGALHVLALWHQKVMQLSKLERLAAKVLLGGQVFGKASWDEAVRNLELAVAAEPNRIVHRLDLGRLYALRKRPEDARVQLMWITDAPLTDFNDLHYKRVAAEALKALK